MFSNGMRESKQSEITIIDASYRIFYSIIQYLYGCLNIQSDILIDLLRTANRYLITKLCELCVKLIALELTQTNILSVLIVAEDCSLYSLKRECLSFIRSKYILTHYPSTLVAKFGFVLSKDFTQ